MSTAKKYRKTTGGAIGIPAVPTNIVMPDTSTQVSYHPSYNITTLNLWRTVFDGGQKFITLYLRAHFEEDSLVFQTRRDMAYNPCFAREALMDFANAITQRADDIERVGGSPLYQRVIHGELGGVNNRGSDINTFICNEIVPELLCMQRVAVVVDNLYFDASRASIADTMDIHPYMYKIQAENILNWRYDNTGRLIAVLLRVMEDKLENGLPVGTVTSYVRYTQRPDRTVFYEKFSVDDGGVTSKRYVSKVLQVPAVPVTIFTLPHSLFDEACRYQIALLNLASSDFFYAWSANFPFYTEQISEIDFRKFNELRRKDTPVSEELTAIEKLREEDARKSDESRVKVGTLTGRQYPKGTERPAFIHPSTDPMTAAMKKEEQLKNEIRRLIGLAVSTLDPSQISAASKEKDRESGLEAGLSRIGRVLESGENTIVRDFHAFEGVSDIATIKYPLKFNLRSDEDRRNEAEQLMKLQHAVPSPTFSREVGVKIIDAMFSASRSIKDLETMRDEVRASKVPSSDPEVLRSDHEAGFVSDATASEGRGYAKGEAEAAQKDHAARLARIKIAQTEGGGFAAGARGVGDADANPDATARDEKTKVVVERTDQT